MIDCTEIPKIQQQQKTPTWNKRNYSKVEGYKFNIQNQLLSSILAMNFWNLILKTQ